MNGSPAPSAMANPMPVDWPEICWSESVPVIVASMLLESPDTVCVRHA